jgi:hypothetical protein
MCIRDRFKGVYIHRGEDAG